LFQIIFARQRGPLPAMEVQGLAIEIVEIAGQVSLFDLTVSLWTKAQGVLGSIDYNSDLFDEATIDRLILLYNRLLEGLVINPDMPITRVPLLNEAERHQIIVEWNRTESEFPRQQSIPQLFEAQVRHCLYAVAIIDQDKR